MVGFNQEWRDLGSWNSLIELSKNDIKLDPKVKIYNDSKNSRVISDKRNTILNDVSNIIVVSKKDSLLVSSKKNVNNLNKILKDKKNESIVNFQSIFYKPWGFYEHY